MGLRRSHALRLHCVKVKVTGLVDHPSDSIIKLKLFFNLFINTLQDQMEYWRDSASNIKNEHLDKQVRLSIFTNLVICAKNAKQDFHSEKSSLRDDF